MDRFWDLVVRLLEWRNRNYVPPQLSEWEQSRADAQLAAAVEAVERGRVRDVLRYLKNG